MADFTTTTNLSLKKPAIGGSSDKWGEYINANLDTIDIEIQTLKTASSSRTLESLSNVLNLTPTTGQVLQYGIASWSATTLSIPEDVEDLSNVTVTSPSDGQVLTWSTSNSRWENQTPGAATIPNGSITSAKLSTSLQGQLNLILQTTGTPTDDQILRYNATTTNWEFQDLPGGTISALSDTDVSGISNQDVLVYNSTSGDWVSRPLAIADVTGLQTALDAKLESSDLSVSSLTDTTITTTADNSVLVYDASDSKWKNEGPSTARSSLGLGTLATQNTITESQISDLGSYITASSTDTLTNKSGAISQWTNDSGYLTAETNDLTASVTWANVPDINITQSSVVQHQAALTITESQISDLGSYITANSTDTLTNKSGAISQWTNDSGYLTAETNDLGSAVTGTLPIANGGTSATTASAARIALLPTLGTAGQVLAVNTGASDVEWVDAAAGGGSGTVTSVAISGTDGIEVDSGSPITTSGTINLGINATTLSSHLSLGTAATTAATDYATAAQGALADSAVQPGDNLNTLGSGSELAGKVIRSNGSGGVAWYGLTVDLPTEVASTLQVANGGTGVTSLGSLDAADLGSGAATDGYVLTADGAGGAAWEASSGGAASLPIDLLSSGASIRKSDGTTAVLSESGAAATLNNINLGNAVIFPVGHVIQTICQTGFTSTSDTSGTGTTNTLYCGWTASITLNSASNKILLMLNLPFQVTRSGGSPYLLNVLLYHQKGTLSTSGSGGTLSLTGTSGSAIADLYPYRLASGGTLDGVITHQRLVTTDNVNNHFTFSATITSDMDSGYFNRQYGDGSLYSITLMEIAQ